MAAESCEEYTVNTNENNEDSCDKEDNVSVTGNGTEVETDEEPVTNGTGNCSIETASNTSLEDTVAKLEHALSRKFKLVSSRNNLNTKKTTGGPKVEPPGIVQLKSMMVVMLLGRRSTNITITYMFILRVLQLSNFNIT